MLDLYKDKQTLFYNFVINSFNNNKLSHAYLIELNDLSYGYELVDNFVKFLLCNGKFNQRICTLIDRNMYSNFYVIDSQNQIKKEQIINLQEEFSYKSIDDNIKVYLIKDASLLNDSSANSLLKFLEEPNENIIAVLVCNNLNDIKETIVSRCQVISLINDEKFDYKNLFKYYNSDNIELDFDEFVKIEYEKFINFYLNLEKYGILVLKDKCIYDYNLRFTELLKFGLYLYFDLINAILEREMKRYVLSDKLLNRFLNFNNYDSILKKLDLLNKYFILSTNNVNKNLFFDNFIIMFGGVKND